MFISGRHFLASCVAKMVQKFMQLSVMIFHILFPFLFLDGFDFSDGWKKHLEESDKKARVILESYYKKCQENNVSDGCGIQICRWLSFNT